MSYPFKSRGQSNRFVFPRQSPVIIGYYNDSSYATGPRTWSVNLGGGSPPAVPDIHGPRLGDLVFSRADTAAFESTAFSLMGQGQAHPTATARTLLNGVQMDENIVYLGISPYDYNDSKYTDAGNIFDCQVGGTVQTHYFAPKGAINISIGDLIVWDFPDEALVRTGQDWGYRKGPTGDPDRLTLVTRRFVDVLDNWMTWDNLVNPNRISHRHLRDTVSRTQVSDAIRAAAAIGRDFAATDEEKATIRRMNRACFSLYNTARSYVIGKALSAATPGDDFLLHQADSA